MSNRRLYKNTIVIWTIDRPKDENASLERLALEVEMGNAYCSKQTTEEVAEPTEDVDWDGTEFFGNGEED